MTEKQKKQLTDEAALRQSMTAKLASRGVVDPKRATKEQLYEVTVAAMKDVILKNRSAFHKRVAAAEGKKVFYLCMEFLIGRSLENNVKNLGLYDALTHILGDFGSSFDEIFSCETDPGLGNGGLGRLAACFMDSLSTLSYPAVGYSLCYENGLFKQKLVDGEQIELPDSWWRDGGAWLFPRPEKSVTVRFGGRVEEQWENGTLRIFHTEYDEVKAVPYDIMIPGVETDATNTLRLWRAREAHAPTEEYDSQEKYLRALEESGKAEEITRQLYPPDNHDEGKLLRLTQQYFLVSASLQNIISDYFAANGSLAGFADRIALHINDTHPALTIPELMRILMDVYSFSWEGAWEIVTKTVSYTNHTVLPEALETWRVDLFRMKLPRIYTIVEEINRRFTAELWKLYPGDWDRISRMAIIGYGQVRMANLCVVGSHTVNGVSQLHSEILKKTVFADFYRMTPWKFTNVTNGVVHRRWLSHANPELSSLLDETIGSDWRMYPQTLEKLAAFRDDASVLSALSEVKRTRKERFSDYAATRYGVKIDPASVFDVQIKRMHEYKRQLLNTLKIISYYNEILENPNTDLPPQTFIFGAKAAPGYYMAKQLIKLIYFLSREVEANPLTRDRIKILFAEEYNVSLAELLIPSADISEQISLSGKEASGTGCMKLMMNGALTVGTLDGANVEILDAVGEENMYVFGLNAFEVEDLWRRGYDSRTFYQASPRLAAAVNRLYSPIGGQSFAHIADYLVNNGHNMADPYMCLADFESYRFTYDRALADYRDRTEWTKRSLSNIAASGRFAADNSIRRYAEQIWHLTAIGGKS